MNEKKISQFSTPEEREHAISALQTEIQRLMDEIEKGYSHLGRSIHALSEQEAKGINDNVDRVVELKKKLRKLRERDSTSPR